MFFPDMRNEVVTLSVWPTQEWYDEYMVWSPLDFGGIARTGISPDNIWKPEIVLYNNVDGRFEVEFKSRVSDKTHLGSGNVLLSILSLNGAIACLILGLLAAAVGFIALSVKRTMNSSKAVPP